MNGLSSLKVDLGGWLFVVPQKWEYRIAFKEDCNESIEGGGRHIAGTFELRSSRGNCSIHFDARVAIGINDQEAREPKGAEVVWTGPETLK